MSDNFNKLTPAEDERLTILMEECAEVIQEAAKIQRHGWSAHHPLHGEYDNRAKLEEELGHLICAKNRLLRHDLSPGNVAHHRHEKHLSARNYLHHNVD